MPTVRYTTVDGEVIAEKRGGVRKQYVPDPLGSTVALLDNTQVQTDTFSYWPYGEEQSHTGTTPIPFRFVGTLGYYHDSVTRTYVIARYLDIQKGRWLTQDPISFARENWNLYKYCMNNPARYVDPSGNVPVIDPSCKEITNVQAGFTMACNAIKSAVGQKCINNLGPEYKKCINNYCNSDSRINCGSHECAVRKRKCTRALTNPPHWPFKCIVTICTGTIGNPACWNPGVTNVQQQIAKTLIHEAMHCCGMLDHSRNGKDPNNPAEDVARCIMCLPGHEGAY